MKKKIAWGCGNLICILRPKLNSCLTLVQVSSITESYINSLQHPWMTFRFLWNLPSGHLGYLSSYSIPSPGVPRTQASLLFLEPAKQGPCSVTVPLCSPTSCPTTCSPLSPLSAETSPPADRPSRTYPKPVLLSFSRPCWSPQDFAGSEAVLHNHVFGRLVSCKGSLTKKKKPKKTPCAFPAKSPSAQMVSSTQQTCILLSPTTNSLNKWSECVCVHTCSHRHTHRVLIGSFIFCISWCRKEVSFLEDWRDHPFQG